MLIDIQSRRGARVALVICVLAALPTLLFAVRTYRSFELLQSAYEAGAAKTSSIRPWMTLKYVAATYRVAETTLAEGLGLPENEDPGTSLKALADRAQVSPPQYVRRVQRIIAERGSDVGSDRNNSETGWLGALGDRILTALLVYGYPVLGGTLLLGAVGLPLPDGIATTIAGSLAAQGRMNWMWAGIIAVVASVLGDLVGYGLGHILGREVLERHGRWFGYTAARRARVELLFEQWGSLTVFITRTFVSYLSSIASLLAGMSRFDPAKFVVIALAGRVAWTAAYLGLGYTIAGDLEAAASFLTNISAFLAFATVLVVSGLIASRQRRREPAPGSA